MASAIRWAVVCILALVATPSRADLSGNASVIDGDTIEIHGQRIRLHGIDAPESGQVCRLDDKIWRCGQQASFALDRKIAGRSVTCREKDIDTYHRIVAVCFVGEEDLNAWMVSEGWAQAYRRYSTAYVNEERAAGAARKGLWQGEFVPPWDWRRGVRLATVNEVKSVQCRIKGNLSAKGERIYHVPGGEYYNRTEINAAKGERWFCTEEEARAAGWRRSKR